MDDAKIVDMYWDRNEDAIVCTQQKYGAYLLKIARNIRSDTQDSEECVNDTYLAAWNSMPVNRPRILSTYLGKIVRQLSIDVFRKKTSQKRGGTEYALSYDELNEDVSSGPNPLQELEAKQLAEAISAFLRELDQTKRNVFIGRYYFFDSVREIAGYCGISESNAKTMLFRLRKQLREYLIKEGYGI